MKNHLLTAKMDELKTVRGQYKQALGKLEELNTQLFSKLISDSNSGKWFYYILKLILENLECGNSSTRTIDM